VPRRSNPHQLLVGNTLVPRRRYDPVDGTPFLVGFITVMKQFHGDDMRQVVQLIGQYLRSVVENAKTTNADFGPDAATLVVSLQWMLLYGAVTQDVSKHCLTLPPPLSRVDFSCQLFFQIVAACVPGYVIRTLQTA
jgi:hypothetical protein